MNEYPARPDWLSDFPNVTAELTPPQNLGDAEKFRAVGDWDGIALTCDDDVLYPADYVQTIISGLERHGRHCVVGFHGGKTLRWSGNHGAAQDKRIRCLGNLRLDDSDVNVLGTGAMAWNTRHVPVWRELFRYANCADVQFACHAHRYGIPMVALAHEAGWLEDICPPGRSIYQSNANADESACDTRKVRERLIKETKWTRPGSRPKVRVSIATCDRPKLLGELLGDLVAATAAAEIELSVYQDPTEADYSDAKAVVAEHGWDWHTFGWRLGKREHWRLVNRELRDCERSSAEWFLFLPDDVRLVRHAIPRAIEVWGRLRNPSALTLWRLTWLEGKPNWTGRKPVEGPDAAEVFHLDGLYLCRRETLAALNFRCREVLRRPEQAQLGSGVGSRLSRALHAQRRRMYRVNVSLAIPNDNGVSIMNPAERLEHPAMVAA